MNRRSLLRAGAASLPVGLAGCSGIIGGGSTENPAGNGGPATTSAENTVPVGTKQTFGETFAITIEDVALRETVFHPSDEDASDAHLTTFGAASSELLAVVTVSVENTGKEVDQLGESTLQLEGGSWYGNSSDAPSTIVGFGGDRFQNGAIPPVEPGETATGYYLAKVPREDANETLLVTTAPNNQQARAKLAWTKPPASGAQRALPDCSLDSVSVPEEPTTGLPYDIELTVSNDGDANGVFRGLLQWQTREGWEQLTRASSSVDMDTHLRTDGAIRTPLEAGESKTVTVTSYGRFAQVLDYRVKSTDASWQTEFRPASVALGEQIRANEQTLLEVEAVRTQSQLELLAGGEKEPQGAGEDKYFVAVKCHWARAVDDVASRSPGEGSFTIGTENIDDVGTRWQLGNRASIAEPWHSRVEKSLDRHTDVTGWYVWTVDTDFAPEDLLVHYERDADSGENFEPLVVEWTQE